MLVKTKYGLCFCAVFAATLFFLSCSWLDFSDDGDDDGDIDIPVYDYPPQKPAGLSAVANNSKEITVSWQAIQDATSYRLYSSTDSLGEYSPLLTTSTQRTIGGLHALTKYYFKLVAVNNAGDSEFSDIVSQRTLIDTPQNLTATLLPYNNLTLIWDGVFGGENLTRGVGGEKPDDGVIYNVYISQSSNGPFTLARETDETRVSFFDLDSEKTYYFKVSAVDKIGREGAKSDHVSASVLGDLPLAPQNLSVFLQIDGLDKGKIGADLSWGEVIGATEYRVYYSTAPQSSYELFAPTLDNSTFVGGLLQGRTYYFRVSAVNANGEGARSSEVFVQTPPPSAPSTPTGLSVVGTATDRIQITWNHVSNATGYRLHTSTSLSGTYRFWEIAGDRVSNSITMSGIPSPGATRCVKVLAFNEHGESPLSAPVCAATLTN